MGCHSRGHREPAGTECLAHTGQAQSPVSPAGWIVEMQNMLRGNSWCQAPGQDRAPCSGGESQPERLQGGGASWPSGL